jgi:pimeloyl-ACP methyl ester carboxylesterase
VFGPPKQIDAGVLNIGYAELGPPRGRPVVLHHGWPYDIHSYADVAPLLASGGYRTIVPYLRGYGTTRFLSPDTFRNEAGEQAQATPRRVKAHAISDLPFQNYRSV